MIRIEHLNKTYPNITPLKDVSATIHDGDVISVIGPSGTGKSTLLRCINLLEVPTSGHIFVNDTEITSPGCDISRIRQKMGMVFQSFNLFGHMTVIENIMFSPVKLLGKTKQEAYETGRGLLKLVGLSDKAFNYPEELSGGQKQRVAIARTLAMEPDTILLDEPTSALDPTMVGEVQTVISELAEMGKTLMIVTHEMAFARAISNRVFFMDEGGIYEDGTPEQIFDHPKGENTRRFIRRLKVFSLSIEGSGYDYPHAVGELDRYCSKNQLSKIQSNRIRLVFEELVHQLLISAFKEHEVQVSIEYSNEDKTVHFAVNYGGEPLNALTGGDALPLAVLKCTGVEMTYRLQEEEPLRNRIDVLIPPA